MTDLSTAESTAVGGYDIDVPFEHQYDSKVASEVSYYMYRRLFPLSEPTTALNGTSYSEFEIVPSQVFNLSKSYLDFDVTVPASGGAALANYLHNGFIAPIDTIELTTASGRQLAFLQNVPYMTKIMLRPTTSYDDFLSNPQPGVSNAAIAFPTTIAANGTSSRCCMFHRNDSVSQIGAADKFGAGMIGTLDGGPAITEGNYINPSNWLVGPYNVATAIRYSLPLNMFAGSLLSVNKDLYFGQTIRLRITWNQGKFFGFIGALPPVANATPPFADPSIPNVVNGRIRLAIQANPVSEQAVKQRVVTDGIKLNVPYTHTFKYTQNAAGDISPTRKINKSHGQRLLRIYTTVFNAASESTGGAIYCQNYNVNNLLFTQVRSQLDGKNLQDSNLLLSAGDLYLSLQDRLDKSVGGSAGSFYQSCYMLDDWTPWKTKDSKQGDSMVAGLSLAEERQYDITFTAVQPNPLVFQFIVCQKLLTINRDGVMFE